MRELNWPDSIAFGRLTYSPGLPQMAPLVCGEDVQSCRQAEANATDERIREAHAG